MNSNERIEYRKSLPKFSIWDFSSSSDDDIPTKKPKIQISEAVPKLEKSESFQREYGPTLKHEVKEINKKLLESLGYVNRNNRPPSSKKNEILPSLDTKKPLVPPSTEDRRTKEQEKISQIKLLLNKQKISKDSK